MRIRVRIDGRRPRRWHEQLLARLAGLPDTRVEVDARPGPVGWPEGADTLFSLESLIARMPRTGAQEPARDPAFAAYPMGDGVPDLLLDLCGDAPEGAARTLRLTFDGAPGEAALLGSLLAGHAPFVAISENGRPLIAGRVGTEMRGLLLPSFNDALVRTAGMVEAALRRPPAGDGTAAPQPAVPLPRLPASYLAAYGGRLLARSIAQRLYHLCYRAPHWRVGWRRLDGPDLIDLRRHPETGWTDMPDDGRRFYADPFPIERDGEGFVFVEEYIHAIDKGVISALRFGPGGPKGTPVPVLEEPHHLSYPFVFEAEGSVWMIPESGAAETIDLYRATDFPGGWRKEATLVSGLVASDATLIQKDGRWWMLATVCPARAEAPFGGGSFSDALHVWSAPDFRGPWTPHPANPVLVDIASARPAGRIISRNGRLIRPAQNCERGYGNALALARIDRLDDEGYAQTVETVIRSGPLWGGSRIHTLNRSEHFEFIDGSARAPRLPGLPR
ncbi:MULTISPECIES: formyl transferase [Methylobacterium]|uniref:Glucosamine inositolphosphorylceramide transferase 1 N-terminal domain-containing protein n=3 Tax=Pseudomonadota TaxID=1224 RepID=A0ABQ4SYZ6_9HYPH|nr:MULTISPECIES: formyl transferase [Methylobacterium]PIU08260.1 MAG: formyl transferase [Methylobacterium sp. CG09_land_8_20_14_0_10_71_15]PIU12887.1 MAG: formyl transferase [Methylobacterium sp. CG08_land_8_20_14_0_20_71_15]GBU17519.1 hypothetical protein AwMethylo_17340 [Methylobacterium sp.]GJE07133.1 hypothetical protein AOPFMNJM_2457 [Methylobacterium jeotgali]